ncbi:MAG: universal stress protein [Verrucomicrobia bacterium]|nr:universal stress protein [Verrucomicrobiota bacterium]
MKSRVTKRAVTTRETVEPQADSEKRPATRRAGQNVKIRNILVPTDFSKSANTALKFALVFAEQFDAQVTLLYVVEVPVFRDFEAYPLALDGNSAIQQAKGHLERLKAEQGTAAERIKAVKATIGKPFREITSAARTMKQDLIIIATHGRTGLKRVFLGSTAEKVIRHASCPVLVVR